MLYRNVQYGMSNGCRIYKICWIYMILESRDRSFINLIVIKYIEKSTFTFIDSLLHEHQQNKQWQYKSQYCYCFLDLSEFACFSRSPACRNQSIAAFSTFLSSGPIVGTDNTASNFERCETK